MTDFRSFEQFSGWWGLGPNFKEKGWQGPPGSSSFSGFLTLKVSLENQGEGTLVAWCLMSEVLKRHPHLANPDGHVSDGISLTGGKFNFTEFKENEMTGPLYQGLMFYSTDPASGGYVLTPEGTTVPRGRLRTRITTNSKASATDGTSLVWPLAFSAFCEGTSEKS